MPYLPPPPQFSPLQVLRRVQQVTVKSTDADDLATNSQLTLNNLATFLADVERCFDDVTSRVNVTNAVVTSLQSNVTRAAQVAWLLRAYTTRFS